MTAILRMTAPRRSALLQEKPSVGKCTGDFRIGDHSGIWRTAMLRLDNTVMGYDWGSRRAIAELQGRAAPTAAPEAELWIGAHASAPSRIRGEETTLAECIAR